MAQYLGRARVERLESGGLGRLRPVGTSEGHRAFAGVHPERKPITWKQRKDELPPLFTEGMLRLPHGIKADSAVSQTWSCSPEPLILYVNWDGGGTDEYCRFVNQSFSITKFTNPNTGTTTAMAIYSAQLIASGKAHFHSYAVEPGGLLFEVYLRDVGGTAQYSFRQQVWVMCDTNMTWINQSEFNPGLYDLIAGATWEITGSQRVDRC